MITKTNPNPEMTEGGFKTVVAQMKGLNDGTIAKQRAAADWKAQYGTLGPTKETGGKDFQADWNKNAGPGAFVLHRMMLENPAELDNLISTMKKSPAGREAIENLTAQTKWIQDHGLFK